MKTENTSTRLKKLMQERNIRQVDILNMCTPYCEKYDVKMNKSDVSQYISGKTEPNQDKLAVLGMALNVNEAWLMGFDVPMERQPKNWMDLFSGGASLINAFPQDKIILQKYNSLDEKGKHTVNIVLEMEYNRCNKPHLVVKAAREIEGASDEDKQHDDNIMNDDNLWK